MRPGLGGGELALGKEIELLLIRTEQEQLSALVEREDAIAWVRTIAERARAKRPGFLVIPQNAAQLLGAGAVVCWLLVRYRGKMSG